MKRLLKTVIISILLLCGCSINNNRFEREKLENHHEEHQLNEGHQLSISNSNLEDSYSEELYSLRQENMMLRKELEKVKENLDYLEWVMKEITSLNDVTFEILSKKTSKNPNETVILVNHAANNKREQIVLKASIILSDQEQISLWTDRESAMTYIEGNYDPLETHTGWPGFDFNIGYINNSGPDPSLLVYLSRDDVLPLNIGKYTVKD